MSGTSPANFTAFDGYRLIASGPLVDVALAVRSATQRDADGPLLVFADATGSVVDLDLRGSPAELKIRYASADAPQSSPPQPTPAGETRGRGRPKLGVVAREVTLLPRHWDWLASQPGGASAALRRLVDEARRADGGETARRTARDAAYRFMSAIAGNLPGFEEASRALFAGDATRFHKHIAAWPADIGTHAAKLAGRIAKVEA
jgi:hypothetical protein